MQPRILTQFVSGAGAGGDGERVPVLPRLSSGTPVAQSESERKSGRRSAFSVLHLPPILLLHGLA